MPLLAALTAATQLVPIIAQYAPQFVDSIKKAAGALSPSEQSEFQQVWDAMRADLKANDTALDAALAAAGH